MAVREYIGARYVPLFSDPIEWDETLAYEPLTVVINQGNSYVSKQFVPAGTPLPTTTERSNAYWLLWADFNAQIEQYRAEVETYSGRINANAAAIANETTNRQAAITSVNDALAQETDARTAADANLDSLIDDEVTARTAADNALQKQITELDSGSRYIAIVGDSFSDGNTEWPSILAANTGYNTIRKAVSATGFSIGSKTFAQQFQEVINDKNFGKCDYIIVYGGVNDWNDAQASVATMQTAFNGIKDLYNGITGKRPKLIFAFGNMGAARNANYSIYGSWYEQCMDALRKMGMPGLVENVPFWLWRNSGSNFNDDNLHPNAQGMRTIASYFAKIIAGTYSGVQWEEEITPNIGTGGKIIARFNNGVTTVGIRVEGYPFSTITRNANQNIGTFSAHTFTFGNTGGRESAARPTLFETYSQYATRPNTYGLELTRFLFNTANANVYTNLAGETFTTNDKSQSATITCEGF